MSQLAGQAADEFHYPVVQQWYACFETDRHAGPVDLGENVIRQIGERIL